MVSLLSLSLIQILSKKYFNLQNNLLFISFFFLLIKWGMEIRIYILPINDIFEL